jgi:hypothetical protein
LGADTYFHREFLKAISLERFNRDMGF